MVMRCEQALRDSERYRTRVRAPQRALRRANPRLARLITPVAPRIFELSGVVRVFRHPPDLAPFSDLPVIAALDTALEAHGLRRWSGDADSWYYVSEWSAIDALVHTGRLQEFTEEDLQDPDQPLVHVCQASEPVEPVVSATGVAVTATPRLLEDLVGRYGPRYDLFARLVPSGLLT